MTSTTSDHRAAVDAPVAVRAASTGFTILLLGGLCAPLAATLLPVVGRYWLVAVAVTAFIVAGVRIGTASVPALHGAVCAVGGYLLMLPIVAMTAGLHIGPVVGTVAAAVVLGASSGHFAGLGKRRTG